MRQIVFRGKRIDNGEWIEGSLSENDVILGEIIDFNEEFVTHEFWYKVIPETVGQYTELKDKHGKPVFEGDIVKFKTYKKPEAMRRGVDAHGVVVYAGDRFKLSVNLPKDYRTFPCLYENKAIEVVGNSHDEKSDGADDNHIVDLNKMVEVG